MITLKIDGQTVQTEKGSTILAAAETVGISIPTLCYLKKLSPTGACRICVVEVKGAEKPMAACHTIAEEGMEITTQSPQLAAIRRQIIELLLVNHPLDCPVCDAAGECDLQNICYAHDVTSQPFCAEDVNAAPITGWPLIEQVPNRCVLCEKCVKVCHEVIGADALFVNDKGDRAFIDKRLDKCEFCGNCVQVCPTGTMISKPFKFLARCWELTKVPSTCVSCGSQCQIDLGVKNDRLYRVTSEDGKTVNDGTLCFNGFFGTDYVHAPQRLAAPLLRDSSGHQRPVNWSEALERAANALKAAGSAVAGIAGSRLTNEEAYLFQTLFRQALKSNNLDSDGRYGALRVYKTLRDALGLRGGTAGLGHIAQSQAVLVLGADPTAEAPAVDWLVQKASRMHDGTLVVAASHALKLNQYANVPMVCRPGSEGILAAALGRLILDRNLADLSRLQQEVANLDELKAFYAGVDVAAVATACGVSRELLEEAADLLGNAPSVAIVFGGALYRDEQAAANLAAVVNLALVSGALATSAGGLFPIGAGGNSQGLCDMGVACDLLPGGLANPAAGRDLAAILSGIEAGEIKALVVAGTDPLLFAESGRWHKALAKLESLVVLDLFSSELTAMAHVVLPGASFAEKQGSVTSSGQRVSPLQAAIAPHGDARPEATILANLIARIAPEALPKDEVLAAEVARAAAKPAFVPASGGLRALPMTFSVPLDGAVLIAGKDLYYAAPTNRYSAASRDVVAGGYIALSPADAAALGVSASARIRVTAATGSLEGPLMICDQLSAGTVFVPLNCPDVNVQQILPLGANAVSVTISRT